MKNKIGSLLFLIVLVLTFKPGVALAYYAPELGRFIQPDTIIPDISNPQSYNRYSYCLNNPLSHNDPSGHDPAFAPGMSIFEGLSVQGTVSASRTAAPATVGIGVAMITGGAATPLLVEAGASTTFAAVGSGMIAGAAGDLASQGTQIGLGTRSSINEQEVAVSGLVGGAIGGTVAGVSKLVSGNASTSEVRPAMDQPRGGNGVVLRDGEGATPAEIQASQTGPTAGVRTGQGAVRNTIIQQELQNNNGVIRCWRCGITGTDPADFHLGHRNVPTSAGGNLGQANVVPECASCNLSSGSRGAPSPGMSGAERGSPGAPYDR